MVVHVLVDLHPEELRRDELAELAVPRRARVQARVGAERARQVLVHADGDAQVVVPQPDRVGGQRESARRGRAAVVDVVEGDSREPQERDHRVGVVDLVAPGERELDVAPLDARVREGAADGDRAHLDRRHAREAAERMQPHSHDRDVHPVLPDALAPAQPTGRNAKVTTSLPSASVRNGTSTSSISMPIRGAFASLRRVSTFTSSASST